MNFRQSSPNFWYMINPVVVKDYEQFKETMASMGVSIRYCEKFNIKNKECYFIDFDTEEDIALYEMIKSEYIIEEVIIKQ